MKWVQRSKQGRWEEEERGAGSTVLGPPHASEHFFAARRYTQDPTSRLDAVISRHNRLQLVREGRFAKVVHLDWRRPRPRTDGKKEWPAILTGSGEHEQIHKLRFMYTDCGHRET